MTTAQTPYRFGRKALHLTQRQVAASIGCAVETIKCIERGVVPYPSHVRRLYDLFLGIDTPESMRSDAASVESQ